MKSQSTILIRLAITLAFIYPPVDAFFEPNAWISYFPQFVLSFATTHGISNVMLLGAWGIVEIIIALWILSGRRVFVPSVIATLLLAGIVFFNISLMQILFRDVALALVTITLAWWSYKNPRLS